MDIYNTLKKEHRKVDELFEKIISARNDDTRKKYFEELKLELSSHSEAEHDSLYKLMKKDKESKEMVEHANKEHDEITNYLEKIASLPISSVKWIEQIGELKHSVAHHVESEEGKMFKEAKKVLSKDEEQQALEEFTTLKSKFLEEEK